MFIAFAICVCCLLLRWYLGDERDADAGDGVAAGANKSLVRKKSTIKRVTIKHDINNS